MTRDAAPLRRFRGLFIQKQPSVRLKPNHLEEEESRYSSHWPCVLQICLDGSLSSVTLFKQAAISTLV
jgi:hypothetical protein